MINSLLASSPAGGTGAVGVADSIGAGLPPAAAVQPLLQQPAPPLHQEEQRQQQPGPQQPAQRQEQPQRALFTCELCRALGVTRNLHFGSANGLSSHWCGQHLGQRATVALSDIHRPHLQRWLLASDRWCCTQCYVSSSLSRTHCNNRQCNRPRPYLTPDEGKLTLAADLQTAVDRAAAHAAAVADPVPGGAQVPQVPVAPQMPSLQELQAAGIRTSAHVPVAVRSAFGRELATVIETALSSPGNGTEDGFAAVFLLFACVLPLGPPKKRGGKRRRQQLEPGKLCMQRLAKWKAGEQRLLWESAVQSSRAAAESRGRYRSPGAEQHARARKAMWLASEGRFADALASLPAQGFAADNAATEQALRSLFPSTGLVLERPQAVPDAFQFEEDLVLRCIRSFKPCSAGGTLCMQPQQIKELVSGTGLPHVEQDVLAQVTRLVNRCAAATIPAGFRRMLASAPLYALAKKDGGVRPIAAGETLRRLVSKCMCAVLQQPALAALSPRQVGVAERGGCEAIVHAAAAVVAEHAADDDYALCKVDFANAFNRVSRHFLEIVRKNAQFSGASAWLWATYGDVSHMWWSSKSIDCVTGVQQGDPMGPLLFSLVLKVLTDRIREVQPGLALNAWFLDDGTMIGRTADVRAALQVIQVEGPPLGLHVNLGKCELWWCRHNPRMQMFPAGIKRVTTPGVALLGSAIGSAEFLASELSKRVEKVSDQLLIQLPTLEDSQVELGLLRVCLGVPQLVHAMRTMNPSAVKAALQTADHHITAALEHVVGDTLSLAARAQAALPVSSGGLGVRQATATAEAAYLSSWVSTRSLVSRMLGLQPDAVGPILAAVPVAIAKLNERTGAGQQQPWTANLLLEQQPTQHQLLAAGDQNAFARLLQNGSQDDKARLLSVSNCQAGAWLMAVPRWNLKMAQLEHIIACKLRLGMPCYAPDMYSCLVCGALSDPLGNHSLSCATTSDRMHRHKSQCDCLVASATSAAKGVVLERKGLIPGTQERPGDVSIAGWTRGRTGVFDCTVVSPVVLSVVAHAAVTQGYAAEQAEREKDNKYSEACRLQNLHFVPVAVETFGGWGVQAQETFRMLSAMVAARSGKSHSDELRWMYQRHAVALQRDNARMVLRRMPEYNPP